jgi:glycolate oxidase
MVLNELRKLIGEDKVTEDANTKLAYSSDASMVKGNALIITWPESTEDVQKIIRFANTKFADVVPRGAGTGLAGGAVPKRSIVLNLSRMNKIITIGRDKVIVEAGVVLDDLNNELINYGTFLPVIPSSHSVCTIGGMIACNAAGKRAVHYGKMEDWVDYLEVVDGNARLRRVNDVRKFCGTEGILGVVVRAQLKITKLPKRLTLDVYRFDTTSELQEKITKLKKDAHLLSLEVLCPLTSSFLGLEERFHLIAEYDNTKGGEKDNEEIIKWNELRDKAYTITAQEGYPLIQDPMVKDDDSMRELMNYLKDKHVPFFGHAGIGVLHPCFKDRNDLDDFYTKVLKLGGSVTGEHGVGLLKKKYVTDEEKHRIGFHKKVLDHNNIMNRGKIL